MVVSPGWCEGTRVTFAGCGAPPAPGAARPDLVFVVREELHPRFERRGDDLLTRVQLPLATALTGGCVRITLLDAQVGRPLGLDRFAAHFLPLGAFGSPSGCEVSPPNPVAAWFL